MKKVISILLCALMILNCAGVSVFASTIPQTEQISCTDAIEKYEKESGVKAKTNRYYFLMPNGENGDKGNGAYDNNHYRGEFAPSWYNDCSNTAGVYWWYSNVVAPDVWPGFTMEQGDSNSVYYADIPTDVKSIIFNNYFDRGMDSTHPDYYKSYQSFNIDLNVGYYYGENKLYPYGLKSFADMIYVINPALNDRDELESNNRFGGNWYYYYGNGCYGTSPDNDIKNCVRDDHNHDVDFFVVAGSPELLEFAWDPSYMVNRMEYNKETGLYTKTYVNVKKGTYEFCIVKNGRWEMIGEEEPDKFGSRNKTADVKKDNSTIIITYDGKKAEFEIISQLSACEAVEKYESETGEDVKTHRYYFLMPNGENGLLGKNPYGHNFDKYYPSWHTRYAKNDPCVYWWDSGVADPEHVCGYTMEKGDADCVFYADVPVDVTTIRFNNNIDYTKHLYDEVLYSAFESINIGCEYYDADESENYPDGTDSFDNMIYVIDPSIQTYSPIDSIIAVGAGEWYYYYGDGSFGFEKDGDYSDCLRDDHTHTRAKDNRLYFDANTSKWENTDKIYCHIYDEDGNYFFEWLTKKEKCIDTNKDGVWTYDLNNAGIHLEDGKKYNVIFSNGLNGQSQSIAFTTENLGQTAYCTGLYLDTDKQFLFPDLGFRKTTAKTDCPLGDVDNDMVVSVLDATAIQLFKASMLTLTDEQLNVSDVDLDGNVSVLDATAIQLKLAGI